MKLKIVHQNQESRGGEEQVMKKEALEIEQMEEPQIRVSPEDESMKENSPLLEPSPISASHPMLVSVSFLCLEYVNFDGCVGRYNVLISDLVCCF